MMDERERLDMLLRTKDYQDLTKSEEAFVSNLMELTSYHHLRSSIVELQIEKKKEPRKETKKVLLNQMKEKNRPSWMSIFSYRIQLIPVVALLCSLSIVIFIYRPEREVIVEKIKWKTQEAIADTVYLTKTKLDTIYLIKEIKVPVYQIVKTYREQKIQTDSLSSKSLAEQEDIRKLLIESE